MRMEKIGRIRKRLGNVKNIYTFSFITVHLLALVVISKYLRPEGLICGAPVN